MMRFLTIVFCLLVPLSAHARHFSLPQPLTIIGDVSGDVTFGDDLKLQLGDTGYWFIYNSTGTQFELWSTDVDGGGTDGLIFSIADGTDDIVFTAGQRIYIGTSAWIDQTQVRINYATAAFKNVFAGGTVDLLTGDTGSTITTGNISLVTGDQTNAGNYNSGGVTIGTGDTTTDGNTGDFTAGTGAAGAGAADAGTVRLQTHGTDRITISGPGVVTFPSGYSRHIDMRINAATVGATAPTAVTIGQFRCLQFAQATTAETANISFEVPPEWDGVSDFTAELKWFPESGDAVADGEVVEFDITYRSLTEGEAYDNGTATTFSVTHTQSGAGTDKALYETTGTIDFDDANQPLTSGDVVGLSIDLDEAATTYSGDPILCVTEVVYNATGMPYH